MLALESQGVDQNLFQKCFGKWCSPPNVDPKNGTPWNHEKFEERYIRDGPKRNEPRLNHNGLPSGKRLHSYGKSPFFMGKSTISMAIFNGYVRNYQRVFNGFSVGATSRWQIPSSPSSSRAPPALGDLLPTSFTTAKNPMTKARPNFAQFFLHLVAVLACSNQIAK